MKDETDELSRPCSKKDLGMHLVGTTVDRIRAGTRWTGPLMRVHSILRHTHPVEAHKYPYCTKRERHSLAHVISHCSFPITLETRTKTWEGLAPTVKIIKNHQAQPTSWYHGGTSPQTLKWR